MAPTLTSPGVFREDVFIKPAAALPTGVPGFVGVASGASGAPVAPFVPVPIHRKEELAAQFATPPSSYLQDAVNGFFANDGDTCFVVPVDPSTLDEASLIKGIEALGPVDDLDLVVVPDAFLLLPDDAAVRRVQKAALAHCRQHRNRFAILDAPNGVDPTQSVSAAAATLRAWRDDVITGESDPSYGALYYPWIKTTAGRLVPPSGHVAGIYARTDADTGVFRPPANQEIFDVFDLEFPIDAVIQGELNPDSIDCLRAFPGRGLRVYGARTLSPDPSWRYISVRRLFITVGRWIDRNMLFATFEPNAPRLWIRIQRELRVYLDKLWRSGALKGDVAADAYFIKCDGETNPPEERELGQVTTLIGMAPVVPHEFIVVRIIHRLGRGEQI